jgi:hypothetical protein
MYTMKYYTIKTIAIVLWLGPACSFYSLKAHAQLAIPFGAYLHTTNGAILNLQDIDLVNNGTVSQPIGGGKFIFSGVANNVIAGAGYSFLDILEISKTGTTAIQLNQPVNIGSGINFTSGLIDLNGYTILLQPAAALNNESETSRITGVTGGEVRITNPAVNAPTSLNMGNIGASITSAQDLGSLEIDRIHQPAVSASNAAFSGIQRTFLIIPANNTALNATLRFNYFAAELNGKDENTLALWKSTDGIDWVLIGEDSRNTTTHFVEKNGIADFSYWTLSDNLNPLPLTLLSINVTCGNNVALLQWQTTNETNAASFIVEKSQDGVTWTDGQSIAAENIPSGASYSWRDVSPGGAAFYRLKMVDIDGRFTYSPIVSGSCTSAAMPLAVYPNPAHTEATATLSVRQSAGAKILIYSAGGQLISEHIWDLQPGINNYLLPEVAMLAAGSYFVKVMLNGTSMQAQLIKE